MSHAETMCHLCAQIAGDPTGDLLYPHFPGAQYRRAICAETETLVVIPSIGPLVAGHVLLVPSRHVRSFAGLANVDGDRAGIAACNLAETLAEIFQQPVHRFEHGSSHFGDTVACSVEHAHLHLVPSEVEVWPLIKSSGNWIELASRELATVVGDREYLLYVHPDGRRSVWITDQESIPSQFMRRAFAVALGTPECWDWRNHPRPALIRETFTMLAGLPLTESPHSVSV